APAGPCQLPAVAGKARAELWLGRLFPGPQRGTPELAAKAAHGAPCLRGPTIRVGLQAGRGMTKKAFKWIGIALAVFVLASLLSLYAYGRFAERARGPVVTALPLAPADTAIDRAV